MILYHTYENNSRQFEKFYKLIIICRIVFYFIKERELIHKIISNLFLATEAPFVQVRFYKAQKNTSHIFIDFFNFKLSVETRSRFVVFALHDQHFK